MRDLALFRGDTWDAGWKQERDAGILITSESGISYFYGDGMRESQGENSSIREFSFVLTKKLFIALTERKWLFKVYIAFVVKLWVSKESKACQILPIITCVFVRLFRFCYFRRFRHSERGIKSLRISSTRNPESTGWNPVDQHWFLFCWRIWPFLLLPGRTCRTWTILWTESGHGMATPELMEVDNDDNVVDIINHGHPTRI